MACMEKPLTALGVFRDLLCISLALVLWLTAPLVLGRLCGHAWGFMAAAVAVVGWLYLGRKLRVSEFALSTRVIWLLFLAILICTGVFDFTGLWH